MASNRVRAIAISLAVALAPIGAGAVWAQDPPAATAASLQATIQQAAAAAAATPGFKNLSAKDKLTVIQGKVAAALGKSGASDTVIAAALIQAVSEGTINAGVAVVVASSTAPTMAQSVAQSQVVQTQLAQSGQSVASITTAANDAGVGGTTVLTNLASVSSTSTTQTTTTAGGDTGTTTTTPAPYDPCAGVTAAYCGG